MFDELVISVAKRRPTHTRWALLVALAGEMSALGVLLMIPAIGIEAPPSSWHQMSLLPPPAPTAVPRAAPVARSNPPPARPPTTVTPFLAPHAKIIHDPTPPKAANGTGSLQFAGAIPGVGGDNKWTSILSQGSPAPEAPILAVGGEVQSAKLIHMVQPEYPLSARKAHIQGAVIVAARIAKDGTVIALRYVNGPPSLLPAVEEAVSQWRYLPTLLNGEPIEVQTTITVIFRLLPAKRGKQPAAQRPDKDTSSGQYH